MCAHVRAREDRGARERWRPTSNAPLSALYPESRAFYIPSPHPHFLHELHSVQPMHACPAVCPQSEEERKAFDIQEYGHLILGKLQVGP